MVHVLNITSGNLYCYGGNNPVKYVDPDGRETYDYEITKEQFFKISNGIKVIDNRLEPTLNDQTWSEIQQFFEHNPNGIIYRNPDEAAYQIYSNVGKDRPVEYNMITGDELLFLGLEKSLFSLGKNLVRNVFRRTVIEVTEHGAGQIAMRGFTQKRLAEIIAKGTSEISPSRYGTQIKYVLGKNTVVIANEGRNAGKIITAFSTETVNGIRGYWVKP